MSGDAAREMVLLSATLAPGGAVPLHTHPGDCIGSMVEGTVELVVEGREPRRLAPARVSPTCAVPCTAFEMPATAPHAC